MNIILPNTMKERIAEIGSIKQKNVMGAKFEFSSEHISHEDEIWKRELSGYIKYN